MYMSSALTGLWYSEYLNPPGNTSRRVGASVDTTHRLVRWCTVTWQTRVPAHFLLWRPLVHTLPAGTHSLSSMADTVIAALWRKDVGIIWSLFFCLGLEIDRNHLKSSFTNPNVYSYNFLFVAIFLIRHSFSWSKSNHPKRRESGTLITVNSSFLSYV